MTNNLNYPDLFVSLKIHDKFPDKLICVGIENEETSKWSAAICDYDDIEGMGETIYSMDDYSYGSADEALFVLDGILELIFNNIKAMSN